MKIERLIFLVVCIFGSCTSSFLDVKPNKSQVVPSTVKDLQAILDNTNIMNTATPYLPELGSGDFYVEDGYLLSQSVILRNTYLWKADIYEGNSIVLDWSQPYQMVFYANLVLEKLEDLRGGQEYEGLDFVRGSALFFRAWAFYQLAQQFCKPYGSTTADNDLGIPIRLSTDLNLKSVRSTVVATYRRILTDLEESLPLLPKESISKTRPTQAAAAALLAKTYLLMGNYEAALDNAKRCLAENIYLVDYNDVEGSVEFPFGQFNDEVIFHSIMHYSPIFRESNLIVDQELYDMYDDNDLRKTLFFSQVDGNVRFRGSYNGSYHLFTGIATDEIYLIKAECEARLSMPEMAKQSLQVLLVSRYEQGNYSLEEGIEADALLDIVLMERRKELLLRGIRWSDLRRLNMDSRYAITLKREVAGETYILEPGDPKYVFAIPDLAIELSGMQQNERK